MNVMRFIVLILALAVAVCLAVWWGCSSGTSPPSVGQPLPPATRPNALRIAVQPEHDVFTLRRSYKDLASYLESKLGQPVEIVTVNTYQAVLQDFQQKEIDGAFLGSLIAVFTMDRFSAQPIARPEDARGVSTYRGHIFVRDDSPIQSLEEIRGKSIAMLRATTAGSLFPACEMHRRGWPMDDHTKIVWAGTHDEVMDAVASGRAEVGAVKDLRYDQYLQSNPRQKFRILATSERVPNNALVLRRSVAEAVGGRFRQVLLDMKDDPAAQHALRAIGAAKFIPCPEEDFAPVYEMIQCAGDEFQHVGVPGALPRRLATTQPARK